MGFTFSELDEMSVGEVWDIMTELSNDQYEYPLVADAAQIDAF